MIVFVFLAFLNFYATATLFNIYEYAFNELMQLTGTVVVGADWTLHPWRHNSNVGGVTVGQAKHHLSNVGGVTACQVIHNSSNN